MTDEVTDESVEPEGDLSGPWADDIRSTFDDPAVQQQVHEFLSGTVQPYVTKIEQDSVGNRDAQRLWDDFENDAEGTFLAVAGELFGAEARDSVIAALRGDEGPEAQKVAEQAVFEESENQGVELPDDVREAVDFYNRTKAEAEYGEEVERIQKDVLGDDIKIHDEIFHPFVVAARGDFDVAAEGYKNWYQLAEQKFGPDPSAEEVEAAGDTPPPTINSESRTPATPPVQKENQTLDEAIDDFLDEVRPAPPTVGSV